MNNRVYTILLCDDDEISLGVNQKYIELFGKRLKRNFCCKAFQEYTEELKQMISDGVFDIALLDIQFPNKNGIEIARELQRVNPAIPIMFATNFSEYKEIASDMVAVGYMEKPIFPAKFEILLKRAIGQIDQEEDQAEFLQLCVNRKKTLLRFQDIICIEIIQKKLIFTTKKGKVSCRETMQTIERKLPANFIRISQSVIVNVHGVLQMNKGEVFLKNGDRYSIGRTFMESVKERYKVYTR